MKKLGPAHTLSAIIVLALVGSLAMDICLADTTLGAKPIDAKITSVSLPSGTYKAGGSVPVRYSAQNTGFDKTHITFYFGYSVKDPSGKWWDAPYDSVVIKPGKTGSTTLSWWIPKNAPKGKYGLTIAVWGMKSGNKLDNLLDRKSYDNVFQIK